jgi:hypothetical protein
MPKIRSAQCGFWRAPNFNYCWRRDNWLSSVQRNAHLGKKSRKSWCANFLRTLLESA